MDENKAQAPESGTAKVPSNFWEYVKSMGPGIVLVLTWLGAGDLVDNALAGANYGYALMWAAALALIVRYLLCNIIADYQLMNVKGHSVFEGYTALSRVFPILLTIGAIVMGHFYCSYMIKGAGQALHHLTGNSLNILAWSTIAMICGFLVAGRAIYKQIEVVEKIILGVMAVCFIGGAIAVGADFGAMAAGTFAFEVPPTVGRFDALLIAISLIGAIGGSIANLLYPTFIQERGWFGPKFKKVVRYDLIFGILVIIVLDLSVWVLGAEVLHPKGLTIDNFNDLAKLLGELLGRVGETIIYLGVLGATFSSIIGYIYGFPLMAIECWHLANPHRKEKYPDRKKDPLVKVYMAIVGGLSLIWALPNMPGFVTLTVMVNALQIVLLPLIAVGLILMINKRELMGEAVGRLGTKVQTGLLVILAILSVWGAIKIIMGFFG